MSARQVVFHRLAAREYRLARDWYRARSPETAQRFLMAIDRAINRIAADTESLPQISGKYCLIRAARFPYVLICRKCSDTWIVVAVAHTSRRPGYWRHRK